MSLLGGRNGLNHKSVWSVKQNVLPQTMGLPSRRLGDDRIAVLALGQEHLGEVLSCHVLRESGVMNLLIRELRGILFLTSE